MKRIQSLTPLAFFTVCLAVGMASGTLPTGGGAGAVGAYGSGVRGCPTATLEGTVSSIDLANQKFVLVDHNNEAFGVVGNEKTRYRIPGYKKKDLKADGLGKLPVERRAKVRYCFDNGDVLEVKVKKLKKKKG